MLKLLIYFDFSAHISEVASYIDVNWYKQNEIKIGSIMKYIVLIQYAKTRHLTTYRGGHIFRYTRCDTNRL